MQRIISHREMNLRRPVLVLAYSGWSDAGQVATNAVKFMSQQLDAQPLASIEADEFFDFTVNRPSVHVVDGSQRVIAWHTTDFMAASVGTAEQDYIFGVGPEPHLRWQTYCSTIVDFVRHHDVQMVVLLGGYLVEVLYSKPVPVTGFGSDADLLRRLEVSMTQYEGPTGIIGVLGGAFRDAGIPYLSLWAALPHYIASLPNPRGTLALLLRFGQAVRTPLDLSPLHTAAVTFEEHVEQAIAQDPKLAAYVRELKKREVTH